MINTSDNATKIPHAMLADKASSRLGSTLVEVTISTILIGGLMVASLQTLGSATRTATISSRMQEAISLAEMVAQETAALPFADDNTDKTIGFEAGEDNSVTRRDEVDDLDDLHNWSESPPKWADGNPIDGYAGWSLTITVNHLDITPDGSGALSSSGSDTGLKQITVSVTDPEGEVTNLCALRARSGALETAPILDTSWITLMQAELTTGGSAAARATSSSINRALSP